jgi:adhesin/invasin
MLTADSLFLTAHQTRGRAIRSSDAGNPSVARSRRWPVVLLPFLLALIQLVSLETPLRAQVLGNIQAAAGQCSHTGYNPEPSPATSNKLGSTYTELAIDPAGNLYISDEKNNRIRMVNTAGGVTGTINTIGGVGGGDGYDGDDYNGLATAARLNGPHGIAVDPTTGDIYFADSDNEVIRRFTIGGNMVRVAGQGGRRLSSGDGGPGLDATLNKPTGIALDKPNHLLYIVENGGNRLRVLDLTTGIINTVAGTGRAGTGGIGGPAASAELDEPWSVTVSRAGVPYIGEYQQAFRITKVENGNLTLVAGNGSSAWSGDGGPPTGAGLTAAGLAFQGDNFLFVGDSDNNRLRRIDFANNIITTVAGTGGSGCTGDGGAALAATIENASSIAITANNRLYVGQEKKGFIRTMLSTSPPAAVTLVSGAPQSAVVAANFASPFVVVVQDSGGNTLSGITVTFAGGGETVNPAIATTDNNGLAQTSVTASTAIGTYTVTASVAGVSTPATGSFTNLAGTVADLTFSTQPTNITAGATITPAVVVRASDAYANPVSGVAINLSAQGGSGALSGTTVATTNSSGSAAFSNLTINRTGLYTLTASDGLRFGNSGTFTVTAAGAASITVVAGNNQSAAIGAAYASELKAGVQDSLGNSIPGVQVIFTAPASGPSVTFLGPSSVTTDISGVAGVTVAANTQPGAFQVNATVAGAAGPAVFNLANIAGAASRLAFVQEPVDSIAGVTLTPPVTVRIVDSQGNNVSQADVPVTLALNPVQGRFRGLSGTVTEPTSTAGAATFSDLRVTTAGRYQFVATAPSLGSAESSTFFISAGPTSGIRATSGTPQSTAIYGPFPILLRAVVTDSLGNPVVGVPVSFTAPGSGASAALSAPSAETDSAGAATVAATANGVVGSYPVNASVAGVSSPAAFSLTNVASAGANLVFTQHPADAAAGALISPVVLRLTDTGGNPAGGITVALTAQGGGGVLSGATPEVTDAAGFVTFSNLSIDKTGTYSLQATDGVRFTTSNSFVVSAGAASSITVVAGSGQSATVGSSYPSLLKASVQDPLGNGVPGVTVVFTAPATGPSITFSGLGTSGPLSATTDNTGVASASVIANSQVGPFQVTAAASGTLAQAIFELTNVPGADNQLAFVQQPTDTAAGVVISPPIKVQVTDSAGNSTASPGLAVALLLNPAAGRLRAVSGSQVAITDDAGLATFFNLSITSAGTYSFTATSPALVSRISNQFQVLAGAPSAIQAIDGTPQSAVVLSPFAVPLQTIVTDSFGNALSGVTVAFTAPISGPSATLSAFNVSTDPGGHASVTATANAVSGSYAVLASVSGIGPPARFELTNLGGATASLVFTQQPSNTPAGAIMSPVTVRVTDTGGNPVQGETIALSAQGGSGVLSGATPTATDASGQATFTNLSIDKTGTYALQATDGVRNTLSASFAITSGTASNITVVTGSGQSAAVGAPYASPLKASVRDAHGNGIPGVAVTFSAPPTGPGVTFAGPPTVNTDGAGLAAISVTANTQAGSFEVTAAAPGISTPAIFNLTNLPGSASRLAFVQQPSATAAGAIMAPPVTVQITDSVGTPIAQAGIAVSLSVNPHSGRLRSVTGTLAITNASGLATFDAVSISAAGDYQMTASAASLASVESGSFVVSAGAAAVIQATGGTPQSTTVLAPFAVPLQLLVTDSYGNALNGVPVEFTAPTSGASATLPASSITDANGRASVSAVANGATGSYIVTASVSGVSPAASFFLTNLGGAGSNLAFTQQPADTAAGAVMEPVTVRASDSGGNPVSGITIMLTAQGGAGVLSGAVPITTDASGLAVFSNLSINKTGTYALEASDGTRFALSAAFVVSSATSSSISVAAGNGQSSAITTNYLVPLKIVLQDSLGNPISGVDVTFAAPAGGPGITFEGSATVATDSLGGAGVFVTANSQLGPFQITAAAPGTPTPAVFTLTNVSGAASRLKVVQQPSNTPAGALITPPMSVRITDSLGNNVAQAGVAVTVSLIPAGQLVPVSGETTVQTDAGGLATFSGLSISSAGNYQFAAIAPSLISALTNSFTVAAGTPALIQETAGTPQSATVLAPFAVPLQARVTDSLDNPLGAIVVTFTAPASNASATLSAPTATTDANGYASVTAVANHIAGAYTVHAAAAGVSQSASFSLTNLGGAGSNLAFTQQPVNTAAGAVMAPVIVHASDAGGNPVSGVTVTVSAQGGSGILSGATPLVTNSAGDATFSHLSIDKAGTYSLQATDGIRFAISASFMITPGTASNITVVAGSGQSAPIGTLYASPLKASVQDAGGNGVPGVHVTFTAPAGGPSVTFAGPATVTTDSAGVASVGVTANTQGGSFQVTATAPNTAAPAVFSLTNVASSASRLTFVQQPADGRAGIPLNPVTVQLLDALGNKVPQAGVTVTLALNPIGARLRALNGSTVSSTDAGGLATFPGLSITSAGNYQFIASAVSLSSAQSNSFRIAAGPPIAIQVEGTPQTAALSAPFAAPLQATVLDSFGNPVAGSTVAFTVPQSGPSASLSATAVVTDANGKASVTAIANSVEGSYGVSAAVPATAAFGSFALTNVRGVSTLLSFVQQPANASAGSTLAPVIVQLTDTARAPLNSAMVSLAGVGGTGSLSGTLSAATDANGRATFNDLRIDTTGSYHLVASTGPLWAPSNPFQIDPATGRTITVLEGNGQNAKAGEPYATSLKVLVRDSLGNAVSNVPVTFAAPASGASVVFAGNPAVSTDAGGIAVSPSLTANSQPGVFHITSTLGETEAQATFNLQVLPATANAFRFVQQPVDAVAGAPIAPAVRIQIVTPLGSPAAQAGVSVSLQLSASAGASLGVAGATAQTDATGAATFANLSVSQAGTFRLVTDAPGFASEISTAFQVTGGPPGSIVALTGTPQSATIRTVFAQPLAALVTDSAGDPLAGTVVTFAAPGSGPSGTFTGNASTVAVTTDINGRAIAPAFTANSTIGAFNLSATVAEVSRAAVFAMANLTPAALKLVFVTQPSNAVAGVAIAPVRVQIQDSTGQPANLSGVAILISQSQGSGSLAGDEVRTTDVDGIATFNNLRFDAAGTKRLRAFGTAYAQADSNEFQIVAGPPASILAVTGGGQIVGPLGQFPGPLQARVEDSLGNPVSGVSVTFSLPASGSSGSFAGTPVVQTGPDGIATSPRITANNIQGVVSATAAANTGDLAQFVLAIIQPSSGSLRIDQTTMRFDQSFGGPPPDAQEASINSVTNSSLSWTATSTAPWLTVSPLAGVTPAAIVVSANGAGLAPGVYGGLVTVSEPNGDQQSTLVTFTISDTAELLAQPSQLAFLTVAEAGQQPVPPAPQKILLTSVNSDDSISYQAVAQVQTPSGGTWLSVSPSTGATPGSVTVAADPAGLQPGIYAGFVSIIPSDAGIPPVLVSITFVVGCGAAGCPPPQPAGFLVANAASFRPGGAPGATETLFGSYLAQEAQTAASYPLPVSLGGTKVLVNGVAAPLYYVSPSQINFQMPSATSLGQARVEVVTDGGTSSPLTPFITLAQPGMYVDEDRRASALNQDHSLHTPQTPIPAGSIAILYLTGMGPATPSVPDGQPAPASPLSFLDGAVQAIVGSVRANVQFAGLAPGYVGLVQVNVQIPTGLTPGDQPVFVTINGLPANAGLITVK